jgi:hypothetical protein
VIVTYGDKEGHQGDCPHAPVACPHEGCAETPQRDSLREHEGSCPNRPILCKCGQVRMAMAHPTLHSLHAAPDSPKTLNHDADLESSLLTRCPPGVASRLWRRRCTRATVASVLRSSCAAPSYPTSKLY